MILAVNKTSPISHCHTAPGLTYDVSSTHSRSNLCPVWLSCINNPHQCMTSDLGRRHCGCWGWTLGGRGVAGQGTSHTDDPKLGQWWRSTVSWCTQCHSADPGTSGCWPVWSMGQSCSLEKTSGKRVYVLIIRHTLPFLVGGVRFVAPAGS